MGKLWEETEKRALGLDKPNFIYSKSKKSEQKQISDKHKELINKFIDYCSENIPIEFIETRKYDPEIIKRLGLGICTKEVYAKLREDYELQDLKDAGFIKGKTRIYLDRVIFPYGDSYFSARTQNPEEEHKYKNLFPKGLSKLPYFLKGETDETLILCEGETDAISLKHLFPEHNILGVGGVQTAKKYIEKIPDSVKEIIICFDNDKAGQEAKIKLLNLLTETEYKIKTISFNNSFKDIDDLFRKYQEETINNINIVTETINILDDRFLKPNLLEEIHKELDYTHKLDHKEKIALFLIAMSSYLKEPNDHCSSALKGDASAGKDNLIKSVLDLLPEEDSFFLTRGTQASLESEAEKVKMIAFSEINKHRDKGANSELTEVFKQLAEGGTNSMKMAKDNETVINNKSEQKTLFYGTTETDSDEELETRYVIIPVRSNSNKNKIVVNDVLDKACSEEHFLKKQSKNQWIKNGIRKLEKDLNIIIPFSYLFKEKIYDPEDNEEKYLFDLNKERIKRDSKRLLSLTRAITWLYQKQRVIKEIEGQKFLYSEPSDFITAINIFAEFFNLTYSGLDHRLQKTLDKIKELEGKHTDKIIGFGFDLTFSGWVIRHELQKELGIDSINTIKKHIEDLKDLSKIEVHWDNTKPKAYLIQGVNQGVNRVSLPVSLIGIDRLLTGYLTGKKEEKPYGNKEIINIDLSFIEEKQEKKKENTSLFSEKLTPSKLTPSISKDTQVKKCCKEDIINYIELNKNIVSTDDLYDYFGIKYKISIDSFLEKLSNEGDLINPKPNFWSVL